MRCISFCCISLTKLEMVIFPSTTQREERIIHQSVARGYWTPHHSLFPLQPFVLVYKDFIGQKHMEDFCEESTCAQLLAYVCVLCFQMFPYDKKEILKGRIDGINCFH